MHLAQIGSDQVSSHEATASEAIASTDSSSIAASLDLSEHVNDETALVGDAIIEHLAKELGPRRGAEVGMAVLAHVLRRCGGARYHLSSMKTVRSEIDKGAARKMIRSGFPARRVAQETTLSLWQARRLKEEMDEEIAEERKLRERSRRRAA